MKRREFIKTSAPVALMPFFMNGFSIRAYADSPILQALAASATNTDRVLVLIQLNGGNDGLNTVVPLDQYSNLSNARANIMLDATKVLKLTGLNATGFHPKMTGMRDLYNEGKMAIVQSVGYPQPNYSHFRSTDIWLTASDSDKVVESGWLGRYLNEEYPGFPDNYPNVDNPDPLAIQIGAMVSPALHGPEVSMGMAISSATDFYQLVTGTYDPAPNTPAGHEISYIRLVAQQTDKYTIAIKNAASKATNKSTKYPAAKLNPLADQLKIVAQLVAGGLQTRIYVVNLNGFDTHAQQVGVTGGTDNGVHANLLSQLSVAIEAFQDDLKLLNAQDRVLGMTFSEFGRRIKSNDSLGTDHGAAAPLFLFGSQVKGGMIGTNPIIPSSVTVNDNLPMQYDFRSVYASVLRDWFGVPQAELEKVLLKDFQSLPVTTTGIREYSAILPQTDLLQNYPNPFSASTRIRFVSDGKPVYLSVYDLEGREVKVLADGRFSEGEHEVLFEANGLRSGTYYYRLQKGNSQLMRSMVYVK
jgi:uncharacterized protein (DUF1501 family)